MNQGAIRKLDRSGVVGALLALALLVRMVVPSGWMPVTGDGYAITLCTGAGMITAWVDEDGVVRKDDGRGKSQASSHACIFAGLSADLLSSTALSIAPAFVALSGAGAMLPFQTVAVGRGLAAPPPPPTGPPASL